MLGDIIEKFIYRAKQGRANIVRKRFWLSVVFADGDQSMTRLQLFGEPFESRFQSQFVEDGRAEFERQRSCFTDRFAQQLIRFVQQLDDGRGIGGGVRRPQLHLADGQCLTDSVVQTDGQSPSLVFLGQR